MLSPLRLEVDALPGSPSPIDLSLIKQHIHEAADVADYDTLIEAYLKAAIHWAEGTTHRTIFARAHTWVLRDFPHAHRMEIRLPRGKTLSVAGIEYAAGGTTRTLTGPSSGSPGGDDYQEDLRGDDGAILMPPRGGSWPSTDCDVPAPVAITFMAGWPLGEVPEDLLHAMLFFIADCYDLRGTQDFTPAAVSAGGPRFGARQTLVSAYRLSRWY